MFERIGENAGRPPKEIKNPYLIANYLNEGRNKFQIIDSSNNNYKEDVEMILLFLSQHKANNGQKGNQKDSDTHVSSISIETNIMNELTDYSPLIRSGNPDNQNLMTHNNQTEPVEILSEAPVRTKSTNKSTEKEIPIVTPEQMEINEDRKRTKEQDKPLPVPVIFHLNEKQMNDFHYYYKFLSMSGKKSLHTNCEFIRILWHIMRI